jgi:thiol-disulfide isomerase/thioredoxin
MYKLKIVILIILMNSLLFGIGPASVGKIAPDFKLKELKNGKYISLQNYRGQIVILDFWATWCAPCKESLPELARLDSENNSLKVLAINIDDKKDNAIKFVDKYGLKFTVPYDQEKNVVASYEIPAIPTAIIIDQEGFIRFLHIGYTKNDLEKIQKEIEEIR